MAPEIKDLEIKDAAGRTLDGIESAEVQGQEEMMGEKTHPQHGPFSPFDPWRATHYLGA